MRNPFTYFLLSALLGLYDYDYDYGYGSVGGAVCICWTWDEGVCII